MCPPSFVPLVWAWALNIQSTVRIPPRYQLIRSSINKLLYRHCCLYKMLVFWMFLLLKMWALILNHCHNSSLKSKASNYKCFKKTNYHKILSKHSDKKKNMNETFLTSVNESNARLTLGLPRTEHSSLVVYPTVAALSLRAVVNFGASLKSCSGYSGGL